MEIQTDHLIPARRPDPALIYKKERTLRLFIDFMVLADHKVKRKENETIDKFLDRVRELKKAVEHEGDGYTDCNWCTWNDLQRLGKKTDGIENQRKNPDHSSVKIGENIII